MSEDNKEVEVKGEVTINKNGDNNIQISDDVVSVIAGMAAAEVPGVSEMAGGFAGGISEVLSGKKICQKESKLTFKKKY